ncbi:K02A2.6-like [Cordylochernes scorpioides]|uniref:RNA-directed DNA polymerase n=1 Tax=Cordylochernes scorpioides TaxID=51811 RepID=A0ABY6KG91_9ARAC|nr:K02A2.6-like [Cordylochernes scorpioides]
MEKQLQSLERALISTTKITVENSKKIADLEEQIEQLERKSREKQMILYGVPRQENEECLTVVKGIIKDKMKIIEELNITQCHRLSKKQDAPILIEVPDYKEILCLFKNAFALRESRISLSIDYSAMVSKRVLNSKRKELQLKGIRAKLRDDRLLVNGTTFKVHNGQVLTLMFCGIRSSLCKDLQQLNVFETKNDADGTVNQQAPHRVRSRPSAAMRWAIPGVRLVLRPPADIFVKTFLSGLKFYIPFYLADKCKFTDINEKLCDQFVSGCFDEATLKRLLSAYSLFMKLPLTLTCDASAYGISGVLCHIVEGEEKPITFVSRTLSSAEVKYSQTEKEALAIVWALELSNFDFDIRYTNKDTMLCADAFSRLPLEEMNSREDNIDLVTHDISFLNVTPLDHLIIEEETNKDPVLNKLKEYLLEDPQLAKKDETMKPFLSKLENFSVLQGCIFVDSRAVIPSTCQDQMLKLLHQSHIGINRMKSLARSSVWWPKMDSQIEEFVKECSPCMHHQTAPPAENTPWPRTNQPWQRVHVDHFYFRGDCYLLVVDANSNWIEVFPVRGTTSQENIKLLRECFARYGLPQCLVSDNGPPFNSIEFKEFLRKNNVYHLTSPAYNPSSNGIAEVSVRIIKKSLEKSLEESPNSNMDCILQSVLFNYRNTPTSLDKPPVERLLSYVPRTFVNCLNSEFIQKTFGRNECGRRHFQVGDKVLFTRVIQNRRKWFKARTGSDTKYAEDSDWTLDNAGAGPHRLEQDPQISTTPPPRRSTRPRRPPCRKGQIETDPSKENLLKDEKPDIASCPVCQQVKFKYKYRPNHMSLPPQSQEPFHTVHLDYAEAPNKGAKSWRLCAGTSSKERKRMAPDWTT